LNSLKLHQTAGEKLLDAFQPYKGFCRSLLDAYVLIDSFGTIQASNQLFGLLVGKPSRQLLGKMSLGELIAFKGDTNNLFIKSLAKLKRPSRFDELQVKISPEDEEKKLIIGVFPFFDKDSTKSKAYIGSLLHIRDITAEASLQGKYVDKAMESITDTLTGLKSRAVLATPEAVFEKDVEHSLLLLDIDHFKRINDTFGHPCGDYVLKELAGVMQNFFGSRPTIIRYGGEEFLIIVPGAGLQQMKNIGQKFIKRVESHPFHFEGVDHSITISCGIIALKQKSEAKKLKDYISQADKALYAAKNAGRNQAHYVYDDNIIPAGEYDSIVQIQSKMSAQFLLEAHKYNKSLYWNTKRDDTFPVLSNLVETWAEDATESKIGEFRYKVARSGELNKLIAYCQGALGSGKRPSINRAILNTAEEMYTNILYDAPTASLKGLAEEKELEGRFKRGSQLELSQAEQGCISIIEEENFWRITASDPWGSFDPQSFWKHYAKSQQTDPKFRCSDNLEEGAGLGILRILYFASIVVCRVWPGKRTEFIVFISKSQAVRPLGNQDRAAAYIRYT